MEWQPIETAPRDASLIDLWCDGFRLADCWWQDLEDMGWVCSKSAGQPFLLSEIGVVPTHWIALTPPSAYEIMMQTTLPNPNRQDKR